MSVAANDRANAIRQDLVVVEFGGAALRNQACCDGKLNEILKFNVAGAIEQTGGGVVGGTDSPEAEC